MNYIYVNNSQSYCANTCVHICYCEELQKVSFFFPLLYSKYNIVFLRFVSDCQLDFGM